MMTVGQREKRTQERVVGLFRDRLGYDYLGNWSERPGNANIETGLLSAWLRKQGYSDVLITRALHRLTETARLAGRSLYDRNKAVFALLRYGIKVQPPGAHTKPVTVWLIDWRHAANNHFAVAEEVTVSGTDAGANAKRPDLVLYVNGIALGVLELKRATVSVCEGIRQNLDNQLPEFIQPFFTTVQWLMAGNDSEGLRYGTIGTQDKHYLQWIESDGPWAAEPNLLDRQLAQVCEKQRILELIHDFVTFDAGIKKLCRHNQYFGVKATQAHIRRREGGILFHTQGSGKTLTMVWNARWLLENNPEARVLIVTDRKELDEQIQDVFMGVGESICRARSGADLIARLNRTEDRLLCTLVHKFGKETAGQDGSDYGKAFIEDLRQLPADFSAKGDLYVFVDECHRTQSGRLHQAMKALLPNALFIGYTGTPLLKADQATSAEIFGRFIHTYKFDQAVREGVALDLRYEARTIDQRLSSSARIDQWFEAKARGLNDVAKAQLKKKWGTLRRLLSSQDRLKTIVADIVMDMNTLPRLRDGRGNAILVAGSIYEACKLYALFADTELKGKCAVISSYAPHVADLKGETTGEGETDARFKYRIYARMLADWFNEPMATAIGKVEQFEQEVKKRFIKEPGQMKLLIVVDKLLTGFDAPSATYLYIDKEMRDHGLFQAICRVNRLDGEDKAYGCIIDYKDLFNSLEAAVLDYTRGPLDGYDPQEVAGLLKNRLELARDDLELARETVKALCEAVPPPRDANAYRHYFCGRQAGNAELLKANEPKRLKFYTHVARLARTYAAVAADLADAGYTPDDIDRIAGEVDHYIKVRDEIKLASGDYIDLKAYEPAMRHLIDTYIHADDSETISTFDDLSLVQLIVDRGPAAIEALPGRIRKNEEAVAEIIENNVRRLIIDETPIDPVYYDKMSRLLDALIEQRRQGALNYQEYLEQIAALARAASHPGVAEHYPASLTTDAQRALFNNLGQDETLTLAVDEAIRLNRQDDWCNGNPYKLKRVRRAIEAVLADKAQAERILDLAQHQREYR